MSICRMNLEVNIVKRWLQWLDHVESMDVGNREQEKDVTGAPPTY